MKKAPRALFSWKWQRLISRRLVAQHEVQDDAVADRDQNIVAADLNPMITARRRAQTVLAPIFDDILPIAIFTWKTVASVEGMIGAGAASVAVIAAMVIAMIVMAAIVVATIIMAAIVMTTVVMMIVVIGKGGASC
jgi:hypothetical protein